MVSFVSHYFDVSEMASYKSFLKIWFSHNSPFDRWLLCACYLDVNQADGFLTTCLSKLNSFSNADLFTQVAMYMTPVSTEMEERRYCLNEAAKRNVRLAANVEVVISNRLEKIHESSQSMEL